MSDLFAPDPEGTPGEGTGAGSAALPLAARMRPLSLAELVGQEHLVVPGSPLRRLAEGADGPAGPASMILWGPPGSGKTTLAHVVARAGGRRFVELSAVTAGVKDVRRVMEEAKNARERQDLGTVLFLDEIHRFSKAQQDALLPGVENRWVILVAATTENPSFSIISPLLSRSLLLTLRPLDTTAIEGLLRRAAQDPRGLDGEVTLSEEAVAHLVRMADGDARRALTSLEAAAGSALARAEEAELSQQAAEDDRATVHDHEGVEGGQEHLVGDHARLHGTAAVVVELLDAERALDRAAVRYDRAADQHYDVTSALIKSLRGSDVDAALHYLARMLEAGEDARFIARRLVIAASEEIAMADPTALQTAVAAAQAVQLIGMPEGRIILAQAVVHLAMAPKSNASYMALNAAVADVRAGLGGPVPPALRDGHYPGAKKLGHAQGYKYAHDDPRGVTQQQYAPDDIAGRDYYAPTERGAERGMGERLARLRAVLRGGGGAQPR